MLSRQQKYSFGRGVPRNSFSTPFFVLRYQKNNDDTLLCAVVASKKVSKRAVDRNRLKRFFLSTVGQLNERQPLGLSAVFYVRKAALQASEKEIENQIIQALERAQK